MSSKNQEEVTSVCSFEIIENEDQKSIKSFQSVQEIEKNTDTKPAEIPAIKEEKIQENEETKALIEEKNEETVEEKEEETEPAQKTAEKQIQTEKPESTTIVIEDVPTTSQSTQVQWKLVGKSIRIGCGDIRDSAKMSIVRLVDKLWPNAKPADRMMYLFELLFFTSCILFWMVQCQYALYLLFIAFLVFIFMEFHKSVQRQKARGIIH